MADFKVSDETNKAVDDAAGPIVGALVEQNNFMLTGAPMKDGKEISVKEWRKALTDKFTEEYKTSTKKVFENQAKLASEKGYIEINIEGEKTRLNIKEQKELDGIQQALVRVLKEKSEHREKHFKTANEIKQALVDQKGKKLSDKEADALFEKLPGALAAAKKGQLDPVGTSFNLYSLEKAVLEMKEKLSDDDKKRLKEVEEKMESLQKKLGGSKKEPGRERVGIDSQVSEVASIQELTGNAQETGAPAAHSMPVNIALALLNADAVSSGGGAAMASLPRGKQQLIIR